MKKIWEMVAEILDSPSKWIIGSSAIDENHHITGPNSDDACQWCFTGAIQRSLGIHRPNHIEPILDGNYSHYRKALVEAHKAIHHLYPDEITLPRDDVPIRNGVSIASWNDRQGPQGFKKVRAVIEYLKEQEAADVSTSTQ